jgi:hypothetical protein
VKEKTVVCSQSFDVLMRTLEIRFVSTDDGLHALCSSLVVICDVFYGQELIALARALESIPASALSLNVAG